MTHRILVVDDDRDMVRTLCDILRLHGWEADPAHSGEEAIDAVRARTYSAIVMDIKMPGISGVSALKVIRGERPTLPVLLMTAHATRDLIVEAERDGAMRVFPKPVAPSVLLQSLERTLRAARSVLIVDEDVDFLRSLSDGLRERGFSPVEARSLDGAVKRLEGEAPAAILLHFRLKDLGTDEAVMAIRQMSPAVALILYSGDAAKLDASEDAVPRDWVYARLQKPFAVERLTALLDELLAG